MGNEKREPLRISVDEAKAHADKGGVTFLDVVDPGPYEQFGYRVEGAVRIDPREIREEFERLPIEQEILTYCTWPNEETSTSVALFLRKQGYRAFAIEGGLQAWSKAGYAVEDKEA